MLYSKSKESYNLIYISHSPFSSSITFSQKQIQHPKKIQEPAAKKKKKKDSTHEVVIKKMNNVEFKMSSKNRAS